MIEIDSYLKVNNICKAFEQPDGSQLLVLDCVSFGLGPGEIMALMGPNGSGKTTLVRLIAGELSPDSGEIWLQGQNITQKPEYQRSTAIGRVYQESYKSLASELTVQEILCIASKRKGRLSFKFARAESVLESVGLYSAEAEQFLRSHLSIPTHLLSGGQNQLLALIVALLGEPSLVLLDEHLASLDQKYRSVADGFLTMYVRTRQCSVIAATHDKEWAEMTASVEGTLSNHVLGIRPLAR